MAAFLPMALLPSICGIAILSRIQPEFSIESLVWRER